MHVCEHDSVYIVHLIDFEFGIYIKGHRWTNSIDFGEFTMHSIFFFTGVQTKNFFTLWPMESNY